jgi:hypothetical protein
LCLIFAHFIDLIVFENIPDPDYWPRLKISGPAIGLLRPLAVRASCLCR